MLSVDNIISSLRVKQQPLPKSFYEEYDILQIEDEVAYKKMMEDMVIVSGTVSKESESAPRMINLYDSVRKVLGGGIFSTTYIHSKSNQSISFRFLDSLFAILQTDFLLQPYTDKVYIFSQWIKKLDEELIGKDRYYEFNYVKNRNMKRGNIQLALNQALAGKSDYEIFDTFIQYTADMMNMSLIILNIQNKEVDFAKSKVFHYKNQYTILNPLGVMIYDHGVFYPVIKNGEGAKDSIFNYDNPEDRERMIGLYKHFGSTPSSTQTSTTDTNLATFLSPVIQEPEPSCETEAAREAEQVSIEVVEEKVVEEKKYKKSVVEKAKMEELRQMCEEVGISIKKRSEKTKNEIYKLKGELVADLMPFCEV